MLTELWKLQTAGAYKSHHSPHEVISVHTACMQDHLPHITCSIWADRSEAWQEIAEQARTRALYYICLLLAQDTHACNIGDCTDSGQTADQHAQHTLHLHASQVHLMTGNAALAWSQASRTCATQPLKCEAACSHAAASTHATAAILLTCGRESVDKAQSICCQWPSTRIAAAAQRSSSSFLGAGLSAPAPGAISFHGYANRPMHTAICEDTRPFEATWGIPSSHQQSYIDTLAWRLTVIALVRP